MRACQVCGVAALKHCGGCANVSYCGQDHQKDDWSKHKDQCGLFRIEKNQDLGEYLVAAKNIQPGDLILHDQVQVLGPATEGGLRKDKEGTRRSGGQEDNEVTRRTGGQEDNEVTRRTGGQEDKEVTRRIEGQEDKEVTRRTGGRDANLLCLGCYFPAFDYSCSKCSAPLCGPQCETTSHHTQECSTLERLGIVDQLRENRHELLEVITPLRFILKKTTDPARFKQCRALSGNLEQRRIEPDFESYLAGADWLASLLPGLTDTQEMLHTLAILDTNTFQVFANGCAVSLSGLYPRVAKLNHSCIPNSRTIFRSDYSLQIIATVPIRKGETIYISYTPPFYTTLARKHILERGKQFTCSCMRCQDPTEMETYLSGIKCDNCPSSYYLRMSKSGEGEGGGIVYRCGSCSSEKTSAQFSKLDSSLLKIQTNFNKEDVMEMEKILETYSKILHPNHALLLETRQHLAAALGRVEGFRYEQLSIKQLQLKLNLSENLLSVLSRLEPGLSKSRGVTLLELAEAKSRILMLNNCEPTVWKLEQVEKELEEAEEILRYEDEAAVEGGVARLARQQLNNLRYYITSLKSTGRT